MVEFDDEVLLVEAIVDVEELLLVLDAVEELDVVTGAVVVVVSAGGSNVENSDVLPSKSVAVARTRSGSLATPGTVILNSA